MFCKTITDNRNLYVLETLTTDILNTEPHPSTVLLHDFMPVKNDYDDNVYVE